MSTPLEYKRLDQHSPIDDYVTTNVLCKRSILANKPNKNPIDFVSSKCPYFEWDAQCTVIRMHQTVAKNCQYPYFIKIMLRFYLERKKQNDDVNFRF